MYTVYGNHTSEDATPWQRWLHLPQEDTVQCTSLSSEWNKVFIYLFLFIGLVKIFHSFNGGQIYGRKELHSSLVETDNYLLLAGGPSHIQLEVKQGMGGVMKIHFIYTNTFIHIHTGKSNSWHSPVVRLTTASPGGVWSRLTPPTKIRKSSTTWQVWEYLKYDGTKVSRKQLINILGRVNLCLP